MFERLTAAIWQNFDAARSEARAKAQTPLAAALEAFFSSAPFKAAIAEIIKAAFNDGVLHERARCAAAALEHAAVDRPTESSPLATLH
jgi:hypothetical protein